jgi:hypothetical protein
METQGNIAGSASALLGLLPFVLGSLTAPLVPSNLFYGIGIPACIIVLNRKKEEDKKGKYSSLMVQMIFKKGKIRILLVNKTLKKLFLHMTNGMKLS